jgi:hypothetical protein
VLGTQTLLSSQRPVFSVQTSNPDNGLKFLILLSLPHIMHATLNLSRSISLTAFPSLLPFPYPTILPIKLPLHDFIYF